MTWAPVEVRFATGDLEIADGLAVQYGGEVRPAEGQPGQFEVVAVMFEELPGGDDGGEVA